MADFWLQNAKKGLKTDFDSERKMAKNGYKFFLIVEIFDFSRTLMSPSGPVL